MLRLICVSFVLWLTFGRNSEPNDMYLDDEIPVGVDDAYELALADDLELEREVGYYKGDDLKDSTEPWDMTSELSNYEDIDDVEDLDSSDSSESRMIAANHQHIKAAHEEALASAAKSKKKKQKKKKSKKNKKEKKHHEKKLIFDAPEQKKDFTDYEHGLSQTEKDDGIVQMQSSIEKDQVNLQALMEDFEKKLSDYENAKISVETSLGHIHDSDEVAVGSSEDFDLDMFEDFDELPVGSSEDFDLDMFEDFDELPVGSSEDFDLDMFEDFDELPVGSSFFLNMFEDADELPVGEEFVDYDEWLEKELGEVPLDYMQWHETALGEIQQMEEDSDLASYDPEDDLQDFEEVLVGDPIEELHADMNDMFDNILYENFDDSEEALGDWLDDDLEDPVGDWVEDYFDESPIGDSSEYH